MIFNGNVKKEKKKKCEIEYESDGKKRKLNGIELKLRFAMNKQAKRILYVNRYMYSSAIENSNFPCLLDTE